MIQDQNKICLSKETFNRILLSYSVVLLFVFVQYVKKQDVDLTSMKEQELFNKFLDFLQSKQKEVKE